MKLIVTYAISIYKGSKYLGNSDDLYIEAAEKLFFHKYFKYTKVSVGPSNIPFYKNVEFWE